MERLANVNADLFLWGGERVYAVVKVLNRTLGFCVAYAR